MFLERSIVIAATFLLIILFIGYLGVKPKTKTEQFDPESPSHQTHDPQCNSECLYLNSRITKLSKKLTARLNKLEKAVQENTKITQDYLTQKAALNNAIKNNSS